MLGFMLRLPRRRRQGRPARRDSDGCPGRIRRSCRVREPRASRAPARDGDVRARRRHVADERLDLGRRRGPRHDGQRRPVGDRARGARLGRVHPDQQQDRRPVRPQARLRAGPAGLRGRRRWRWCSPRTSRAVIIFWAILGGLGASLLLPAMQSLIHGNFEGAAQSSVYALVGAVGGHRRRHRPAARRVHHDLPLVARRLRARARGHRRRAARASAWSRTSPYTGDRAHRPRRRRPSRSSAWAASSWASSSGRRAARPSALLIAIGVVSHGAAGLVAGAAQAPRRAAADRSRTCSSSKQFRLGISGQMLQQIALGGTMIALPIFLQMVLEYNALQAGLSLAPLSLSMFAVATARRSAGGRPAAGARSSGSASCSWSLGIGAALPLVPRVDSGWWLAIPLVDRRLRPRPARLAAQQLHARADLRGAHQRGRRRQLGRRLVRALVRPGAGRRPDARRRSPSLHGAGRGQHGPPARRAGSRSPTVLEEDAEMMSNTALEALLAGEPPSDPGRDHPHQHRGPAASRCRSRCSCRCWPG